MIASEPIPSKKQATYSDYLQTPEGGKFQLIDGELIEMTSPSLNHQEVLLNLVSEIRGYLVKNKIGKVFVAPLDVYFSEEEVYQPDILFLLTASFSKMKENKIEGAPDLVIEVLSPSTAYYDLKHKKSVYAKQGVKEYWIVDPMEKSVEIFENLDGKFSSLGEFKKSESIQSKLISGLEIHLETIF